MLEEQQSESISVELKLNMDKTKVKRNKDAESALVNIMNEPLKQVNDYNYPEQVACADPNHQHEIWRRIRMRWGALGNHSQIMKSTLPVLLKRRMYKKCVVPVTTSGAKLDALLNDLKANVGRFSWPWQEV